MISLTAFNKIKENAETNTRIFTPQKIVKDMIEALPPEVWNSHTTFLDPAVKSGVYLVEIFNTLMESTEVIKDFPDQQQRKDHILKNQLYGIAIDQFDCLIAQRNLYGSITGDSNIRFIEKYMNLVKNKDSRFYIDAVKKEFGEMKFDVIIGNPPYNDADTKVATAVYSRFIQKSVEIGNKYISFIIPARWYNGGRGLDSLRSTLLSQKHLRQLIDFANAGDIFPNVSIAGGVCYFVYDKNYVGNCKVIERAKEGIISESIRDLSKQEVFIRDIKALNIINKIAYTYNSDTYMDFSVQSVDYFSVKDNPFVRGFKHSDDDISIIDSSGTLFAERGYLTDPKMLIDSYNVIVTHAVGGEGYVIPKTIRILNIGEACSVTYLCIGATKNRENAVNLMNYIKTKFCRFLMNQAISGINISAKSFMFVPLQDFTSNSDIDWSKSIADIDQQLYKKYNLTEEEITYIEQTIKPMP